MVLFQKDILKKKISTGEIIGVGLNVNQSKSDFPDELINKTTSLHIETGKFFFLDEILRQIFN